MVEKKPVTDTSKNMIEQIRVNSEYAVMEAGSQGFKGKNLKIKT